MAREPCLPSGVDVRNRVITAIIRLYRRDRELLDRDASERSMTHKLAEYLQCEFPDWNVDCEYNRHGSDPKRLTIPVAEYESDPRDIEARTVFPDIIIHRRGINQNLVVIEVKKRHGDADTRDREKVESFARSPEYRYQLGLLLNLSVNSVPSITRYDLESGMWEDWSKGLHNALRELGYVE